MTAFSDEDDDDDDGARTGVLNEANNQSVGRRNRFIFP